MSYPWCGEYESVHITSRCPDLTSLYVLNQSYRRYPGYLIRFGAIRVGKYLMPQVYIAKSCRTTGRRYNGWVTINFHFTTRYCQRKGSASRNIILDVFTPLRFNTQMARRTYLRWLRRQGITLRRLGEMSEGAQRRLIYRFWRDYITSMALRLMERMDIFLTRCFLSIHCHLYDQSYRAFWFTIDRFPDGYIIGQLCRCANTERGVYSTSCKNIYTPYTRCP